MSWDSALNELNRTLAQIYDREGETERVARSSGLDMTQLDISGKAISNWHNVLLLASNTGRLQQLLDFAVNDSKSPALADAYQRYKNRPASVRAPALDGIRRADKPINWRLVGVVAILCLVCAALVGGAVFAYRRFTTYSFVGHLYCKDSGTPVPFAAVEVVDERRQFPRVLTDQDGKFVIKKVPRFFSVESLKAEYNGAWHEIKVDGSQNNLFPVIPCPTPEPTPPPNYIEAVEWKDGSGGECDVWGGREYPFLARYVLDKTITKPAGDSEKSRLVLVVRFKGDGWIVGADVERPPDVATVSVGEHSTDEQQDKLKVIGWSANAPQQSLQVKLHVCLGADSENTSLSQDGLETYYYFE